MDYLIYNQNSKIVYDKKLNEISPSHSVYKVLEKYKIPLNLIDVKIYGITLESADNGLVYTGKYLTSEKTSFFYGEIHIAKRKEKKTNIFLSINKIKPKIMKSIKSLPEFNSEIYLIKLIILLLFKTGMRLGKREFKIKNDTIGAITLEKNHITIYRNNIYINFGGKKKVINEYRITNKILYQEISKLYNITDSNIELFSNISEYKINNYLKQYNITAKDIRTWFLNDELIKKIVQKKDRDNKEIFKEIALLGNHTLSTSKISYLSDKIIEIILQNNKNKLTKKYIINYLNK